MSVIVVSREASIARLGARSFSFRHSRRGASDLRVQQAGAGGEIRSDQSHFRRAEDVGGSCRRNRRTPGFRAGSRDRLVQNETLSELISGRFCRY